MILAIRDHTSRACRETGFADGPRRGVTISANRIRLILKDPFYVTGEAHVTYQGVVYPLRPIKLVNPVPAEIFERNQALMTAVRGRQRQNALGHFLLNRTTPGRTHPATAQLTSLGCAQALGEVDLAFEASDLGVDELEGFLQVAGVEVAGLADPANWLTWNVCNDASRVRLRDRPV